MGVCYAPVHRFAHLLTHRGAEDVAIALALNRESEEAYKQAASLLEACLIYMPGSDSMVHTQTGWSLTKGA